MDKNPFSFYDFLGYLFPGMMTLLIIIHLIYIDNPTSISDYFNIEKFIKTFKNDISIEWWKTTLLLIIFSYTCGHIISYLSSTTIEYFSNRIFKYPSHYLLHEDKRNYCDYWASYFTDNATFGNICWRIILFFLLCPITCFILPFGSLIHINAFVARPLDAYIRDNITTKFLHLTQKLQLSQPQLESDADYHRIVMHYVYLNIPNCQKKTDNYIAIYGFLRSICLILCTFTVFIFYNAIFSSNIHITPTGWKLVITMIILCNITFMGFVKFYRRFTLENYMALLTEKIDKKEL